MSILQICIAATAILPERLSRQVPRTAADRRHKAAARRVPTAPGRDGVLGSDPYGLWALNDFLSSGSLSHR